MNKTPYMIELELNCSKFLHKGGINGYGRIS